MSKIYSKWISLPVSRISVKKSAIDQYKSGKVYQRAGYRWESLTVNRISVGKSTVEKIENFTSDQSIRGKVCQRGRNQWESVQGGSSHPKSFITGI